jgi:hypothetical protein
MSTSKPKPTRWYYVLAMLIPILACLGTTLLVYPNVPRLPGALEATGVHNLTQVVVPGSADIHFPKAGAYAVYYEYRSIVDGVRYDRDKYPPSISCRLTSKATGADIPLAPDYIAGNKYETQNWERAGVLIKSISIDQPGIYNLSCHYTDGRTCPPIVLAVGPNIVWEFFSIAARTVLTAAAGLAVLLGSGAVAAFVALAIALKRRQSRKAAAGFSSTSPIGGGYGR